MKALLLLLLLSFDVFALPHNKGTLSSLSVGTRFSSLMRQRGVIFYRDFQIDPFVAALFFDDKLEFLTDNIGYRDFIYSDVVRLRTRVLAMRDEPFFPHNPRVRKAGPNREDSAEWNNGIEIFLPAYNDQYRAEIDINHFKDLKAHSGQYVDFQTKIKMAKITWRGTVFEPNLLASTGWGDAKHNAFFYGPGDKKDGFNNVSMGLWLAMPETVDRYYSVLQFTRFATLGDHGKGEYAQGRNEGWLLSIIATVSLLD